MAIDYDKILGIIDQIAARTQDLRNVVLRHKRPYVKIGTATVAFSTEQKAAVLSEYETLRAELKTLWDKLPVVKS